jgi:hypothetical protein
VEWGEQIDRTRSPRVVDRASERRERRERDKRLAAASIKNFRCFNERVPRFRGLGTRFERLTVRMGVLALRVEDMEACFGKRIRGEGG